MSAGITSAGVNAGVGVSAGASAGMSGDGGSDGGGLLGVVDRALATSRVFRQLCRLAGRRHRLTVDDLSRCVALLAPLTAAERVELPGVTRPRAGLILAGAIIAEELLAALNVPYVESCPWGLREGIILHHARTRPLPLQAIPLP